MDIPGALVLAVASIFALSACSSRDSAGAGDLVALGDQTFHDICARCHGPNGHGGLPLSPGGVRPRDFTDQAWQASRTDAQLETVIRTGKAPMPAFGAVLSPRQIEAAIAKIRRIGKEARR